MKVTLKATYHLMDGRKKSFTTTVKSDGDDSLRSCDLLFEALLEIWQNMECLEDDSFDESWEAFNALGERLDVRRQR